MIDRVLVIASDRKNVEQEQIPEFFTPVTGKWSMKCEHSPLPLREGGSVNPMFLGLTKVYADDESYNSGHGHAYEAYGVDPKRGALVVVRPDHCELRQGCPC